jgi:ABC-type multidrug transport system ATPase subunit
MNLAAGLTLSFAMSSWKALLERAGEMTVLMSTHELSEVEGFGTDVAYRGRSINVSRVDGSADRQNAGDTSDYIAERGISPAPP